MPSLNFQNQFVKLIESGKKRQTIRPVRKNPIKVGDKLYLFTGLRTKKCRRLVTPLNVMVSDGSLYYREYYYENYVICKSVEKIKISFYTIEIGGFQYSYDNTRAKTIALQDGFNKYNDFILFFEKQYGLPFEGVLIKW